MVINKGEVIGINDPEDIGRIRVRLSAQNLNHNETPWVYPCSPFAGNNYGWYCMPQIGDEVMVTKANDGTFIWLGYFWTGRNKKPDEGIAASVRIFKTPVGHQMKFDEKGDVEFKHSNGDIIAMRQNGNIDIIVNKDLNLTVKGNVNETISGNLTSKINGNANVDVGGNLSLDAKGRADIKSSGSMTINASGNIDVKSGGTANVKAGGSATIEAGGSASVKAGAVASLEGLTVSIKADTAVSISGLVVSVAGLTQGQSWA